MAVAPDTSTVERLFSSAGFCSARNATNWFQKFWRTWVFWNMQKFMLDNLSFHYDFFLLKISDANLDQLLNYLMQQVFRIHFHFRRKWFKIPKTIFVYFVRFPDVYSSEFLMFFCSSSSSSKRKYFFDGSKRSGFCVSFSFLRKKLFKMAWNLIMHQFSGYLFLKTIH